MPIPKLLQEDAPTEEEVLQQPPEETLGTPQIEPTDPQQSVDLAAQGEQALQQGLGIQRNMQDSTAGDVTDAVTEQAKIASAGMSAAAQSKDRKYDNPALQKIFEDIQTKRAAQEGQRQKTSDSLVNRGLALKKAPGELASQSIKNKLDESNVRVAESTEQSKIDKATAEVDQLIAKVKSEGREHEPISPAYANALAQRYSMKVQDLTGLTPSQVKELLSHRSAAEIESNRALGEGKLELGKDRNKIMGAKQESQDEMRHRLSDAQVKEVNQIDGVIAMAEDIQREAPGIRLGQAEGLKNKAAQLINVDDPKVSAFRAKLGSQLSDYVRSISGTAASNQERAFLEANIPRFEDSSETFNLKMKNFINKSKEIRTRNLEGFKKQGKNTSSFENKGVEQFPKTVKHSDGRSATVQDANELKDANSKGFN